MVQQAHSIAGRALKDVFEKEDARRSAQALVAAWNLALKLARAMALAAAGAPVGLDECVAELRGFVDVHGKDKRAVGTQARIESEYRDYLFLLQQWWKLADYLEMILRAMAEQGRQPGPEGHESAVSV